MPCLASGFILQILIKINSLTQVEFNRAMGDRTSQEICRNLGEQIFGKR